VGDRIPVRRDGPPANVPRYQPPRPRPETSAERKERHKFYGRAQWHKRTRPAKLARNPLCERCLVDNTLVSATDVHHRIDIKDAPELAHDLDNLESLCHECHSQITFSRIRNQQKEPNGQV